MKLRIILPLFLLVAVFVSPAFSQKTIGGGSSGGGNYGQAISADPLDFLINDLINVTYEHRLGSDNSLTVFFQYYNPVEYWTGLGIGASYRWYFDIVKQGSRALEGFSFGPYGALTYWSFDDDYLDYESEATLHVGIEVAYKWIFDGFVVEPIFKYGIPISKVTGLSYDYYGLGCNIGYAW